MRRLIIFTDGSALLEIHNPEMLGGMGVYVVRDTGEEEFVSKGYKYTKTGRMEVMAVLYAVKKIGLGVDIDVKIYSDSKYVVDALTKSWGKWKIYGLSNRTNGDLFVKIDKEIMMRPKAKISVIKIRGHGDNMNDPLQYGNAIADALADYRRHKFYEEDIYKPK